jgi:site-specific DNA-methyltransferase (cytosine-N4-specific)
VDVLAASDRFVYHRWQIQCKNTKRVDVEVLAKEVGMTFVTGADVVMVVTTGEFTRDAFQYAYRMMEVSRYYMVLIQKEDIEAIKEDRTNIIKILDRRARRVFAKKELGLTDNAVDEMETEEDSLTEGFVNSFVSRINLERKPSFKFNGKSVQCGLPVTDWHCPFLRNVL